MLSAGFRQPIVRGDVRSVALAAMLAASLALTGCSAANSNSGSSSTTTPLANPTFSAPPTFNASGTAQENLPFFAFTVQQAIAGNSSVETGSVAKALGVSVFATKGIQYNSERTAAGLASDTSFVAVPFAGKCLVAQFGPAIEGIRALVMDPLKQGGCLVGTGVQTLR